MGKRLKIHGWAKRKAVESTVHEVFSEKDVEQCLNAIGKTIGRGAGRSYGDVAQQKTDTLDLQSMNQFFELNESEKYVDCDAGMTIRSLIDLLAEKGFGLNVVPGTFLVTVGGAVACDVHGKNHASRGSFGNHVLQFEMINAAGKRVVCSPSVNSELFAATIGGVGLTGILLRVRLAVCERKSNAMSVKQSRVSSIEEALKRLKSSEDEYRLAWLKSENQIVISEANWYTGESSLKSPPKGKLGRSFGGILTSSLALNTIEWLRYQRVSEKPKVVHTDEVLCPLDRWEDWNRLYPKGFFQLQFSIGADVMESAVEAVYKTIEDYGWVSFLATIKYFGGIAPMGWMSFPFPNGYTFTVDLKYKPGMETQLKALMDDIVLQGGKIYFAKDALMEPKHMKAYPQLDRFKSFLDDEIKGKFASDFSERVNLTV